MRKLLFFFLTILLIHLCSPPSPALEPATGTAAVHSASGTATQTSPLPPPAADSEPAPKFQRVDPADLLAKAIQVHSTLRSFSVEFTMAQLPSGKGKIKEDHLSRVTERYLLMYLDDNPDDGQYLLRLEALEGYNRRTTVIYAPDEKGKSVYRVFKPALPKGSVLPADSPLVEDVPASLPASILAGIEDQMKDSGSETTAEYYPAANKYVLQVEGKMTIRNREFPQRTIVTFSGADYRLTSQEIHYKPKNEFVFFSKMEWFGFTPDAGISEKEILRTPKFNKE